MFRKHLQKLVENSDGAIAALIMEFDGIAVDSFVQTDFDIQSVGTEFSQIVSQTQRTANILEVGNLEEMMIKTSDLILLFRVINKDYFLALVIKSTGNFGKGRFLMRLAASKIIEEF